MVAVLLMRFVACVFVYAAHTVVFVAVLLMRFLVGYQRGKAIRCKVAVLLMRFGMTLPQILRRLQNLSCRSPYEILGLLRLET